MILYGTVMVGSRGSEPESAQRSRRGSPGRGRPSSEASPPFYLYSAYPITMSPPAYINNSRTLPPAALHRESRRRGQAVMSSFVWRSHSLNYAIPFLVLCTITARKKKEEKKKERRTRKTRNVKLPRLAGWLMQYSTLLYHTTVIL